MISELLAVSDRIPFLAEVIGKNFVAMGKKRMALQQFFFNQGAR
jgi:hypothetical protein